MKSTLNNDVLLLYFEGELNSYNCDNVEKEVEEIIINNQFSSIILDFSNLHYISSAGLRIILKLKQRYIDVKIVEASLEIYDILQMTGFVNIMDIEKALKRVYINGAQVIGEGFFSTVYRIDKDTIIKVFNRTSDSKQIERELKLAKEAFILGIPTAISFDIVRVDDKLGVRFEMLDCISLKNAFIEQPHNYDELVKRYVKLLKQINSTTCLNSNVPDIKEMYLKKVEVLKDLTTPDNYRKTKQLIETIPSLKTFVHGDCHFKNIMVQGDDLLLIDMDTLSTGHPLFELAAIRATYVAFNEDDPGNSERFLGVKDEFCIKLYDDIVNNYYEDLHLTNVELSEIKEKIALVCYLHMVWWTQVNTPDNLVRLNGCLERLLKLLEKYNDLIVG